MFICCDSGLLANMWEFPSVLLGEEDVTYASQKAKMNEVLSEKHQMSEGHLAKRKFIGEVRTLLTFINQYFCIP